MGIKWKRRGRKKELEEITKEREGEGGMNISYHCRIVHFKRRRRRRIDGGKNEIYYIKYANVKNKLNLEKQESW